MSITTTDAELDALLAEIRTLAAERVHKLAPSMLNQRLTLVSAQKTAAHLRKCPLRAGVAPRGFLPVQPVAFQRPADHSSHTADAEAAMADTATPRIPLISTFTDIPAGYYATASRTGNNDLDFWRVDRPEDGKWAGRIFVKRVIGGKPDASQTNMQSRIALLAIRTAGVERAGMKYASELGLCRDCNRTLTDEESRAAGRGPVCRSK